MTKNTRGASVGTKTFLFSLCLASVLFVGITAFDYFDHEESNVELTQDVYSIQELNDGGIDMEKEKVFHGPVPEGYDLEHFRKTGETIPLE